MSEQLTPATPEQHRDPNIKYILCQHTAEFVPEVVNEVKDADIIALEAMGGSPQNRRRYEMLYNDILGFPKESAAASLSLSELKSIASSDMLNFCVPVVAELGGSHKALRLIDIDRSHPYAFQMEYLARVTNELDKIFMEPDNSKIIAGVNAFIEAYAELNETRESLVEAQIEELEAQNPGKKIAVITGAGHTPITYENVKNGKAERVFAANSLSGENTKIDYTPLNQAIRAKLLFPDKPISDDLLKRSVIEMAAYELDYTEQEVFDLSRHTPDAELGMTLNEMIELARRRLQQEAAAKEPELAGQR